ncbi:MAG: PAS domain S-box protein [Mariprofundus sp.]|nr:PAS domain S-box protein [Mariprofundus sp.]
MLQIKGELLLDSKKIFFLHPAIRFMNKMPLATKLILTGVIALVAVCILLFGLYSTLHKTTLNNERQLGGLTLIHPIIRTVQLLQQHRGLSSGVLNGTESLKQFRSATESDIDQLFLTLDKKFPAQASQHLAWLKISSEWKRIKTKGLHWQREKNFSTHTKLIEHILRFESTITDDYGLTAQAHLDSFYLVIAANNEVLKAIEYLGQIRAYGTIILGNRTAIVKRELNISNLLALLNHSRIPLKENLIKAGNYNPSLRSSLLKTHTLIEAVADQVVAVVDRDILHRHFAMAPDDYFALTTKAIDSGYTQIHQALLPTAKRLIQARIQHDMLVLKVSFAIALLLMLCASYLMASIYFSTLGTISSLSQVVLGFTQNNMKERIYLESHDELSKIGDSFNTMADHQLALMAEQKASLDLITKITHSVPGMVYQYRQCADGSACFPFSSEGIHTIYRLSPESVHTDASNVFDIIHPADLDSFMTSLQTSAQNLTLWQHDYRVKFLDGTVQWLRGNATPEREADGATLWHGLMTDISAYKATELKLRMLSAAIEDSPTSVVITDLAAHIEYVNPEFSTVTGYSADEVMGKNPHILNSGKTKPAVYVDLWDKLSRGQAWQGEFVNQRKNGEIYYEEAHISPIRGDDNLTSHYVAVKLNITDRKEHEAELERSNSELEQFSYAVSHDMRQPLRMISSYLQLLEISLGDALDSDQRSYFNFAIDGAKRIDQMLIALLEYSRVGRMQEPHDTVDSQAVLDETLQFLQPAITEAEAKLNITGEWPRIVANYDEIQRLMQNLIGNAVKYRVAERIPDIYIHSMVSKQEWQLCVHDNGIGIATGQSHRLFKVFQRLQAREAYEGTGIGLALCRKIVEHHKGRIWVESVGEGWGSQFYVVLPIKQ